jgi:hypothetical protein
MSPCHYLQRPQAEGRFNGFAESTAPLTAENLGILACLLLTIPSLAKESCNQTPSKI